MNRLIDQEHLQQYLPIAVLLLIGVGLFLLGFNSWAIADDYCNYNTSSQSDNLWAYLVQMYNTWTGRIFTTAIIGIIYSFVTPEATEWLSGICGILVLVIGYYFLKCATPEEKKVHLPLVVFAMAFWFGMKSYMGETVYWITGNMVYSLPMLLFWLWYWLLVTREKQTNLFVICILSLLLGNSIELLVLPPMAVVVALLIRPSLITSRSYSKGYLIFIFICLLLGALILLIAPGNFQRAEHGANSFNIDFLGIVKNVFSFGLRALVFGLPFYFILLFLGLINKVNQARQKLILTAFFILLGFASLAPMLVVPDFASIRSFYIAINIFGMSAFYFGQWLRGYTKLEFSATRVHTIMLLAVAMIFTYSIKKEVSNAINIKEQIDHRSKEIRRLTSSGQSTIAVTCIDGEIPVRLHFADMTESPDHWINNCMGNYYGIERISTDNCSSAH